MLKNKVVVVAMAGMLAMCVGLTACGGSSASSSSAASESAASSSAAAASESTETSSDAAVSESAAAVSTETSSATAASVSASSSAASEILYWEGTLADGSVVTYFDNGTTGEAVLCVAKSDYSDATAWVGGSTVNTDGVVTVTDSESKKTISYTISDITPASMTIDLEGYGEVVLKPVSEADLKAFAEEISAEAAAESDKLMKQVEAGAKEVETEVKNLENEADKIANEIANMDDSTIVYWNGTLADGKSVSFMDDPESKEACISIIDANLSDGAIWYGKYSADADGKTMTITDSETGETVTYQIVKTVPNKVMKVKVKGYGKAKLKPVTKGDFVKLAEELSKVMDESAAQ